MQVTGKHGRMSKISNNLLEIGDEEAPEWTFWVRGMMFERAEWNILAGDRYFDRALFQKKNSLYEPLTGLRKFKRLEFTERYDSAVITIACSGDRSLEFRDGKVFDISLEPKTGGLIDTECKLQFRPGLGKENLILQEHQNREIVLTITDAKLALKKGGQQDLALEHDDEDDDEAELLQKRKTPANYDKRSTIVTPNGETVQLRSGKEIDEANRAITERNRRRRKENGEEQR